MAQLGFEALSKLVLYLEVRSLIYTFGLPNPQLTPSHGTLCDILRGKMEIETILVEIIKILINEETKNENLINSLHNCSGGKWKNKAYYQFVNSINPNQVGSDWKFKIT